MAIYRIFLFTQLCVFLKLVEIVLLREDAHPLLNLI